MKTIDVINLINKKSKERGFNRKDLSDLIKVTPGSVSNALNYEDSRFDKIRVTMLNALGVRAKLTKEIILLD